MNATTMTARDVGQLLLSLGLIDQERFDGFDWEPEPDEDEDKGLMSTEAKLRQTLASLAKIRRPFNSFERDFIKSMTDALKTYGPRVRVSEKQWAVFQRMFAATH